jgi:hypothetical protein
MNKITFKVKKQGCGETVETVHFLSFRERRDFAKAHKGEGGKIYNAYYLQDDTLFCEPNETPLFAYKSYDGRISIMCKGEEE